MSQKRKTFHFGSDAGPLAIRNPRQSGVLICRGVPPWAPHSADLSLKKGRPRRDAPKIRALPFLAFPGFEVPADVIRALQNLFSPESVHDLQFLTRTPIAPPLLWSSK